MKTARPLRTTIAFIIGLIVILVGNALASAQVIGFVVEGSDGKYYEYGYDNLLQS